jgi:PadR family transcriptional regulator, regulatory protein PadR
MVWAKCFWFPFRLKQTQLTNLSAKEVSIMAKRRDGEASILSATEEDILRVVSDTRGVYGLDILNQINKANKATNRREIGVGSLYPALKRMKQQNLVDSRWGEEALGEESGGARRLYYEITESGKESLAATIQYRKVLSSKLSEEPHLNQPPGFAN